MWTVLVIGLYVVSNYTLHGILTVKRSAIVQMGPEKLKHIAIFSNWNQIRADRLIDF